VFYEETKDSGLRNRKGVGLINESHARIAGYEGSAELVWGSWVIEGQARIEERSAESAPVGPREGISSIPDGPSDEGLVGTFTADSGTEPMLLSSLATAFGETYSLRWQRAGRDEELPVAVTARHGNRIHFETRG